MKEERFFYCPAALEGELPKEEALHATRVLRLKQGDTIHIIDGRGNFHEAEVTLASRDKCFYNIVKTTPMRRQWQGTIRLAIAPTKNIDRMEWLVEKATEIGFDEIVFIDCKFSERHEVRMDRMEKIVVAAVKQSRKAWMPAVRGMTAFNELVSAPIAGKKYMAHCYEEFEKENFYELVQSLPHDEDITILVGPEGDFSIDEVNNAISNGFISVSLGKSRLRTETAGLVAVEIMQLCKS